MRAHRSPSRGRVLACRPTFALVSQLWATWPRFALLLDEPRTVEDFLGSSRVVTNSVGSVCYDADFTPFGAERAYTNSCATANNYKFEGKERDAETQNDDFGARYYTWRFGRWLSADWSNVPTPVPYANLTNPQTLNLYAMVADDPESFADLDGHQDGSKACNVQNNEKCGSTDPKTGSSTPQKEQPQQTQQQQPKKGFGILPTVTGAVDLGVGKAGATAQGSAGAGAFIDSSGHPHVGAMASGSTYAYAGKHSAAAPQQDKDSFVAGAYAGVGVGATLTNAGNAPALKSTTKTINFDIGLGPAASISVSSGKSGITSVTIDVGLGLGLAVTETNSSTATTQ